MEAPRAESGRMSRIRSMQAGCAVPQVMQPDGWWLGSRGRQNPVSFVVLPGAVGGQLLSGVLVEGDLSFSVSDWGGPVRCGRRPG